MDDFEEVYDEWVDNIINTQPLTTSRLADFGNVIDVNQRIVNHIYSIRRHLELDDLDNTQNDRWLNRTSNNRNNRFHPYRRQQPRDSDYNNRSFFDILSSSLEEGLLEMMLQESNDDTTTTFDDVKVTLDKEEFNKLKCEVINLDNMDSYKLRECNICIEEYKKDDEVIELSCKHYFHKECIKNWLCDEKVTCPVCRKDIRESV